MKFATVNLTMNVSRGKLNPGGPVECSCGDGGSCNAGGSYGCTAGTKGCDAGLSCVGTSYTHDACGAGSAVELPGLEAVVSVRESEIAALRAELNKVMTRFVTQK